MEICDDQPIFGESTFSLNYRKLNNRDFFASLEESELGIVNGRNYMPIYENYFNLNETNYNSINLNQRFYVSALSGVIDKNNIQSAVVDAFKSTSESLTIVHKPIFIKFSPLIDPVKYMLGKYESLNADGDILDIPVFSKLEKRGLLKANDKNNASYVDAFFSYLSSQVLNCHDFIHGLNFYGSFNAIKKEFYYNVIDDIECLDKNPYFNKNKDILFSVEDIEFCEDDETIDNDNDNDNDNDSNHSNHAHRQRKNTRNKKEKLTIEKNESIEESSTIIHEEFDKVSCELSSIFNVSSDSKEFESSDLVCDEILPLKLDDIVADNGNIIEEVDSIILNKDYQFTNDSDSNDSFTSGSCSSRSSYTSDGQADGGSGSDCDIGDIICLDDSKNDGGSIAKSNNKLKNTTNESKSNKNKKNNKKKSKSLSDASCSEDSGEGDSQGSDSEGEGDKKEKNSSGRGDNNCDDYDEYDDEDEDEYEDDETLWATIKNFPVSAIMLEKCDNTLDSLMMQEKEMTENEWRSALMQIIMTLITYQKLFGFTHNDLHTNNIMYIYTEKQYIYYRYNNKYYRVPTYNRAFKIIDFGRAIYKYKSKIICSDSFSMSGDAATQYNCEPYFNDKKPRLEPNYSFDLCRLGCSIFDYFIDDISNVAAICKKEPLARLIVEWVTDDQNRNILYKANGEERYPDFKLYKMIARSVHNHTPQAQLSKPIFVGYEFPKKSVKSTHRILNIDKMPCYMD
jgi:hypothetical protein